MSRNLMRDIFRNLSNPYRRGKHSVRLLMTPPAERTSWFLGTEVSSSSPRDGWRASFATFAKKRAKKHRGVDGPGTRGPVWQRTQIV